LLKEVKKVRKMLPSLLSPLSVCISVVFIGVVQKYVTVCNRISS